MKLKCYIYFHVIICIFRERHLDTLAGLPMIRNISEHLYFYSMFSVERRAFPRIGFRGYRATDQTFRQSYSVSQETEKAKAKKNPTNSGIVLVIYVVNLLFDAVV